MECHFEYRKGRNYLYGCDYRLYLHRKGTPDKPFDLYVQVIIAKDVVSRCWTTYPVKAKDGESTPDSLIWKGHSSELSKVVADFEQQELLFRVTVLDDSTGRRTGGEKSTKADLIFTQPDLEPLSTDLGSLLDKEVSPDVRFQCKDGVTHAHRLILAARSKVFWTMFQTDMAEKETGEVNVRHIDLQTMRLFLKFVYSGRIPDFPGEMAPDLYVLGDKYDVPSLKGMCSDFMAKNVSEENYIDYLILADVHGDDSFKRSLVYFVINNPVLMRNEQWLKFSAEHMKLALEVFQAHVDKLAVI